MLKLKTPVNQSINQSGVEYTYMCVSSFFRTNTDTNFLSKSTNYLSPMHQMLVWKKESTTTFDWLYQMHGLANQD